MTSIDTELHPVYGAIPSDGEFVRKGEILGLSVDAQEIVRAPVSGWIQLIPNREIESPRLIVQILQNRSQLDGSALFADTAA
jgi:hypothetical protein